MKTVKFGDLDSYADLGLVRSNVEVGSPATKTDSVDIPGADGVLDLTEYFGEVLYENRELSMDFQTMEGAADLEAVTDIDTEIEYSGDGITVYGATVTNLWANPDGTSAGVTVDTNDDGSFSVSGTATDEAGISVQIDTLKPSTKYVFSTDTLISDAGSSLDGCLAVQFYKDGARVKFKNFGHSPDAAVAEVTSPADFDYAACMLYTGKAGNTFDIPVIRVMMGEGGAGPWCEPGTHSVSEVSVASWGKVTAIDLDGNTVGALSADIRDELRISRQGIVKLIKRAQSASEGVTETEIDLGTAHIEAERDFQTTFSRVFNALHGKRMRIQLSEEPGFYYIGRLEVDGWETGEKTGDINITADCEPYKYRASETVKAVTVSGTATASFDNLRKRVMPTFELSASMQVKQGDTTYQASAGTWSDPRLVFDEGANELTFTGTGTVTVKYQERGL